MKKSQCEKALEDKNRLGDSFYSWNQENKRVREQINAYRTEHGHGW